uniref:thiolase family protein n=1 Tax=Nocardioides sediminis TaxID=433648 RepID=UPI0018FF8225|nr:thiolase family protein [Nocardioides sediminis]
MADAVVVGAVRTPMARGKESGALAALHPVELLAQTFTELFDRTGVDPALVDDVLVGCVSQSGEQASTPGRQAWLSAGFPVHVPATTIERKCGSGQQAVDFAVQAITSGASEIVVAAGLEVMSRVPMGSSTLGKDPFGPGVRARFPELTSQGVAAELVADRWGFTRTQLDEYAARSHQLAAATRDAGGFDREIASILTPAGAVSTDETIRPGTTSEGLAGLRTAFATEANLERHPTIDWKITAGNSSQITDGAAALLLMSARKAAELGLRPRARVHIGSVAADDPVLMLTAPIPATEKLLKRTGLTLDEIDAYEVNEAFAPVPLAWAATLGAPLDRLNPRGGAIALGHPLGASGARLMTTLLHHLEDTGGHFGLQTMCEAGGMANATLVEVLS